MEHWMMIAGIMIVSMVILWLALSVYQSFQRLRYAQRAGQLSVAALQQQIDSARRRFEMSSSGWNGFRKFEITSKKQEADDVFSYTLSPHDGKPLSPYRPGQFLTIRLDVPGREKPVVRCYSLSDKFSQESYRITIKKVAPPNDSPLSPPGLVSSYFHEQLQPGDLIDAQSPSGNFVLDPHDRRGAVLIAGGIGITPILSMAKTIIASQSQREFIIFYGVRSGREHAFKEELSSIENHPQCRLVVCYSAATEEDAAQEGREFQHHGRLNVELIRNYLDSTNHQFFMCGLPSMMTDLTGQLTNWGVAKSQILFEAFGPESVKTTSVAGPPPNANQCTITFSRSGVSSAWQPETGNLLEFAHDQGVEIASGCKAGNCGSCLVAIKSGSVGYQAEPGAAPENGSCLPCIAYPKGDLILDA